MPERSTAEIQDDIGAMILGEEPAEETAEDEAPQDEIVDEGPEVEGDDETVEETEESDDESGEESDEPTGEDLVEVEWEGQLIEAPKAVAEALMRQSDYTQKTQEVAAQRKEIELNLKAIEEKNREYAFLAEVQPDLTKAEQLKQQIDQTHKYMKENLDTLSSTEIERIRFAIDEANREKDELVNGIQTKQQAFQQAREQSFKELLNQGTEVLRSKIPSWGESHQKQVRDYALSSGFTEQEISQVVDPRQVEVLWKASQYDALQKGKAAAVKKVTDAPTIKSKARNAMPKDVQAKLNLRKKLKSPNLSAKEKEKLMIQDFGERFG